MRDRSDIRQWYHGSSTGAALRKTADEGQHSSPALVTELARFRPEKQLDNGLNCVSTLVRGGRGIATALAAESARVVAHT